MQVEITNIVWDAPRDVYRTLPSKVTVDLDPEDGDIGDLALDYLSDTYGWCVQSCSYSPEE